MPLFGGRKKDTGGGGGGGGDDTTASTKKSKKKKKKVRVADSSGGGGDGGGSESKSKKIRKMRLRLKKKKKKKKKFKDGVVVDSEGLVDRDAVAASGGGFQLDNVTPGMRPSDVNRKHASAAAGGGGGGGGGGASGSGNADMNKKFRVKPHHAFPQPLYLNETELYNHMMAPSEEFEFLTSYLNPSTKATKRAKVPEVVRRHFGSPREDGRVGSLRVEVLGCVGVDRARPEISVYLVCGDCAFATDIIPGARSPMFPNSAKRACVFPLHHAYARLFMGVFDVRPRKNSEADHFCGRATLDIPQMRPDTEYDVTFPIRASSFIYDRKPRGVVRLRFSLHWFSERAAILSYMKRPRNPLAFSKQAKKQPTVPCGDPKTFRNVAVTVHGEDFPGKYTKAAFRATMREFNLYQQNLRFLAKVTVLDCILYENPLMSLYLFTSSMYCVFLNSVRLVPPFFVGWLIYMLVENYMNHCATSAGHLGYKPLTITEIFFGLVRDGRDKKFNFKPILVKKRARKQVVAEDGTTQDIELMNHREFPFSERFEYHKFAASEAIAPSPASKNKKNKGTDARTARRLSIYLAPVNDDDDDESSSDDSDSDSDADGKDDEGMMDQGDDDGYGNMEDSDAEDEEEEKARLFESGKASTTRRIRVGPPQNSSSTSGRKVPPQVHLSKVEHMLHRATKNISVEHVHFPPPHLQMNLGKEFNAKGPASDVISAKEKQNFDEFDRLLGFRTKNPNPILRITSSFLGPLMRIIRIVIYATRIGFNLTVWRDPYLTFWAFAFLCTLTFVFLIFPWRAFFFLSNIVLLGPQNIFVRKYLERRAKEKAQDEKEKKEREKALKENENQAFLRQQQLQQAAMRDDASAKSKKKKMGWSWGKKKNTDDELEEGVNEADLYHSPRPAFFAHIKPTRRTTVPRDVAVPYFRFRKDRFYDWPPDPTVSRATPLLATSAKPSNQSSHGGGGGDDYDLDGTDRAEGNLRKRR